jgi:hypothetical protein
MEVVQATWSAEARGWAVDCSPECVTFRPPEDDAALQISSAYRQTGPVSPQQLAEMAERSRVRYGGEVRPAACGEFTGLSLEFADGGLFWRRWWLGHRGTLLFVTYNSDERSSAAHRQDVDSILTTLKGVAGCRTRG